jgi:hypothetical protein
LTDFLDCRSCRKSAPASIGGFDPQFTSAGDDVDICWRMLNAGFKLGYCPSAFVWHFRRNTVKAYYGQQRGYGRAEALLYAKYPGRFNALGQIKWQGTIPGLARTMPGGAARRVMWSAARPAIQTVYEPVLGLLNFLPSTLEWNLAGAAALLVAIAGGLTSIPALAILALGPVWALYYAWEAPIERCHDGLLSRLMVAWLAYSGPMVRAMTRYKLRLLAAMKAGSFAESPARQRPQVNLRRRSLLLTYWNEAYSTRDALLDRIHKTLDRAGYPTIADPGWNDFDLEARPSPLAKVQVKTADEEHGGMRLRSLVLLRVRLSRLAALPMLAGAIATAVAAWFGMEYAAFLSGLLTIAFAAVALSEAGESIKRVYRAVEQCAQELELIPLGARTREAARASASSPARAPSPLPNPDLLGDNQPLVD